ncbi:MAG: hypothetical protein ACXV5Q_02275 [Frankiaceae bacterium]
MRRWPARRPRPIPHPARRIRTLAGCAVVLALPGLVWVGLGDPAWWAVPALAAGIAVGELAVVTFTVGRGRWQFSCTFGALGIALLLSPGAWVALGALLGAGVAVTVRRLPRVRAEFAVAELTASASAGVLVAHATGASAGLLGAGVLGIAGAWLVRHLLVAAAVAFTSRRSVFQIFTGGARVSLLHTAGNAATGMLAGWLAVCAPLGLLGLVVPVLLLWSMFELQARQSAEADMFAELVRGQEQASGRSVDVSAQIVVTAVARVLGGADVELVVNGVDGPMRYAGDESGTPDRRRVSPDVFDEPWVMRLLGGSRVVTGEEDGRPFCAALVGQWRQPLAVLVARRPRGSAPFRRREARLACSLVRQVEPWLTLPDVAGVGARGGAGGAPRTPPVDPNPHTAPALALLREASRRLGRLAEATGQDMSPDEALPALLDEVHAVERAVASLLGAVALAADSDEPSAAASAGAAQPARLPQQAKPATLAEPAGELPEVSRGSVRPAGRHVPGPRTSAETHINGPAAAGPGGSVSGPGRPAWTTTGTRP